MTCTAEGRSDDVFIIRPREEYVAAMQSELVAKVPACVGLLVGTALRTGDLEPQTPISSTIRLRRAKWRYKSVLESSSRRFEA